MAIERVIRTLGAVVLLNQEHSRSPVSFGVNAYSSGNPANRTSDKWQTGARVAVENGECNRQRRHVHGVRAKVPRAKSQQGDRSRQVGLSDP
jgi:hypothetical protein